MKTWNDTLVIHIFQNVPQPLSEYSSRIYRIKSYFKFSKRSYGNLKFFHKSLKRPLKTKTAYKFLLRWSHSNDKGWWVIHLLLLPEGFAKILDTITLSQKCWLIWKKPQWALLWVAYSLCYRHSPKILVRTDKNTACTLGLRIYWHGVLPKEEAFLPTHICRSKDTHISGHPLSHIKYSTQVLAPKVYREHWNSEKKWSNVCVSIIILKILALFGETGRVWSWREQL